MIASSGSRGRFMAYAMLLNAALSPLVRVVRKRKRGGKRRREKNEGHTVEGERHPPVLVGGKVFVAKRTLGGC